MAADLKIVQSIKYEDLLLYSPVLSIGCEMNFDF